MKIEKNRHLIILDALTKASESMTAEQLALLSRSSVRTVKNDLKLLNRQLEGEQKNTSCFNKVLPDAQMLKSINDW